MEEILYYFAMSFLAFGVPVLLYIIINYANRKFKQMDLELERRTEAASLTSTELKALLQEAISESLAVLLARVEQNEQRLEGLEQLLEQPARSQIGLETPRSSQGSPLLELESESGEADLGEELPSRKRMRNP